MDGLTGVRAVGAGVGHALGQGQALDGSAVVQQPLAHLPVSGCENRAWQGPLQRGLLDTGHLGGHRSPASSTTGPAGTRPARYSRREPTPPSTPAASAPGREPSKHDRMTPSQGAGSLPSRLSGRSWGEQCPSRPGLTGEVGRDEEEGGAEEGEADAQGPLGLDVRYDACGHCGALHLCGTEGRG